MVREEQLLPAQSGILDITRAEGEEVGRGQTVALVHQNSQALDVQAQMEELAMEIELLDYAMNQTDDVVSAARLDESILQSLASLRFASASGSYRQLDDDVMELKSQVLKRSYTYGEGLDSSQLSALRQSLIEEYRALRTQSSSVTSRITAPAAGVFSSLADGYESLLTPQSILTMTPADLDALARQQVTAPSGTAGKLITSDRWYFAAAVSEEEALRLSKESSVTARFSGSFSQDVPMTLEQVGEAVDGRAAQLAERLRKAGRRYGMQWNLSFTLGLAEKQAGDDYISLFDRADQMLLARKKARRARRADSADAGGERSICTDMALIRRELREKDPPKGAFCQDYETFKQIYRFVERGLKRSGQSAYIILMTLTDAQGQFVPLAAREEYMSRLSDDLQASLRSGDLFAPYSGCQYLLMVLGASSENAAVIAGRIHTRFMSCVAPDAGLLLRYDVYPMGELPLQPKG